MSRRKERAKLCPSPSKHRYEDLEAARESYIEDLGEGWAARVPRLADWAYPCACGKWHRTKRHDREHGGIPLYEVDERGRRV